MHLLLLKKRQERYGKERPKSEGTWDLLPAAMLLADRCMGKAEGLVTLPIHSASPDLVLVLEEGVLMDLLLQFFFSYEISSWMIGISQIGSPKSTFIDRRGDSSRIPPPTFEQREIPE